jgi:hypothetical protein
MVVAFGATVATYVVLRLLLRRRRPDEGERVA